MSSRPTNINTSVPTATNAVPLSKARLAFFQPLSKEAEFDDAMVAKELMNFSPIRLEEMDSVSLLDRMDTKLVLSIHQLPGLLADLTPDYYMLDIEGQRLFTYDSLYFDTPDLSAYHKHHNRRLNRFKVRQRKYVESDLSFIEVKYKNNKNRTIKERKRTSGIHPQLQEHSKSWMKMIYGERFPIASLKPSVRIIFNRLTLVSKDTKERATLDLFLRFSKVDTRLEGEQWYIRPDLVIAEVKQASRDRRSPMLQALLKRNIRPLKVSKYCMTIAHCYPEVKYNRFKHRMTRIEYKLARVKKDLAV